MQTKTTFEGTQHSPETEIEEIEITIKQAQQFVALRDDLARLSKNAAFKRVFLEGYLKDAPVRLTAMLGHPAHKDHQDDIISDLKGIAAFKDYCDTIFRKGDEMSEAIREHELALDEMTADASEEFEELLMVDYENMTDEELAKLEAPEVEAPADPDPSDVPETPEPEAAEASEDTAADTDQGEGGDEPGSEQAQAQAEEAASDEEDTGSDDVDDDAFLKSDHTTPKPTEAKTDTKPEAKTDTKPEAEEPAATAEGDEKPEGEEGQEKAEKDPTPEENQAPSVEDDYKKIMAPFKANGTEFTPKNPDEVIRLMQMGANYGQKMQALKPNLRMMRMLENKGLLDEEKLNYLIDLSDRNPQAIQKLLHESKIDPLDIDTSETPKYTPNNHAVSDAQFTFQETLQDLQSTESGKGTLTAINQSWDKASKEEVFKDPKILTLINDQRQNGIYGRIEAELSRRKMLGDFEGVPFIHAYKAVGDYLHSRGELLPATPEAPAQPAPTGGNAEPVKPREMVETRTATTKAKLANDDRVSGTAPTRSTPPPQKQSFNPLEMSDEEIMRMEVPPS